MNVDVKTNRITVGIDHMELIYGTITNIEAGYPDKKQIEECLEILNKYHDEIEENYANESQVLKSLIR